MFKFIVVIGLCAWIYYKYVSLINTNKKTLDAYNDVNNELKKEYSILLELIIFARKNMSECSGLIDYIDKLKAKSIKLDSQINFINRKIAYDNEIELKTEELIEQIKQSMQYQTDIGASALVKTYRSANENVQISKEIYNDLAHKLRVKVDVFPTSFIARLKGIKSVDYMKNN